MSSMAMVEVDADLKAEAEQILAESGHTVAEALHSLLQRTVEERSVPAELFGATEGFTCNCFSPDYVFRPDAETLEAMHELDSGGGKRFNTVEELMADLLADD